jgi:hypothetical protein
MAHQSLGLRMMTVLFSVRTRESENVSYDAKVEIRTITWTDAFVFRIKPNEASRLDRPRAYGVILVAVGK